MLRISTSSNDSGTVIRLEGKLRKVLLGELRATLDASAGAGPLRLDLAGLRFMDQDAANMLRELTLQGVELVGASPFITELLAAEALRRRLATARPDGPPQVVG